MLYHRRLINHFLHINQWIAQNSAKADLNMQTFQVTVSAYNKTYVLEPQFLFVRGNTIAYTAALTPDVDGFIGWLPYRNKRWPLAHNKLLFKRYIDQSGKRTPQYWLSAELSPDHALIKPAVGSFGLGQRGPFKSIDPANPAHSLEPGQFYEKFRSGSILKAWYWNERPICVEIRPPFFVTGDGLSTVNQLVQSTYAPEGTALQRYKERREALNALLAYQGATWESILPSEQRIMVDYLYGSSLYPDPPDNLNRLNATDDSQLMRELRDCGPIFFRAIPEQIRNNTVYAVDGIIDDLTGDVRWLEMNSNPVFPPDAYSSVLDTLFKD